MVVPYLKKKKMYQLLCSLAEGQLDTMKNASYKFYRGSEWLVCVSKNKEFDKKYELYHCGYFFSLDISEWSECEDEYIEIDRITYKMVNNQLVKEYQRTEA